MKKVFLSILTLLYLMVSSGIAMEIHYCMGKKAGVDFFKYENEKCGKCGMKENKSSCCHDEHQFHKLEDSHKNVFNNINFESADVVYTSSFPVFSWQLPEQQLPSSDLLFNSPPPLPGICPRVMHCVFRI